MRASAPSIIVPCMQGACADGERNIRGCHDEPNGTRVAPTQQIRIGELVIGRDVGGRSSIFTIDATPSARNKLPRSIDLVGYDVDLIRELRFHAKSNVSGSIPLLSIFFCRVGRQQFFLLPLSAFLAVILLWPGPNWSY